MESNESGIYILLKDGLQFQECRRSIMWCVYFDTDGGEMGALHILPMGNQIHAQLDEWPWDN